jgi:RNA polymerase primary sigma factor
MARDFSPFDSESVRTYMLTIESFALIDVDEERRLAGVIKGRNRKKAADATEQLVQANLRLVVKVANDYRGLGVDMLDLIQEGNQGLMKAAGRFDPEKGGKMSTYAIWWIKQAIKRALSNHSRTIRLPVHVCDKVYRLNQVMKSMHAELGRDPSPEEVAECMGMTAKAVRKMLDMNVTTVSINSPRNDGDDSGEIGDNIPDTNARGAGEEAAASDLRENLAPMFHRLDAREREILERRFGMSNLEEETLEQVGRRFGITRERVRQIQKIALQKLRKMFSTLESDSNEVLNTAREALATPVPSRN